MPSRMVTERVKGSSVRDPDLLRKFSHQPDQPAPAEQNTNAAGHLLQGLGRVRLSHASTQ